MKDEGEEGLLIFDVDDADEQMMYDDHQSQLNMVANLPVEIEVHWYTVCLILVVSIGGTDDYYDDGDGDDGTNDAPVNEFIRLSLNISSIPCHTEHESVCFSV